LVIHLFAPIRDKCGPEHKELETNTPLSPLQLRNQLEAQVALFIRWEVTIALALGKCYSIKSLPLEC
jgi:hypothetical protein